jgi:hypothetical protein
MIQLKKLLLFYYILREESFPTFFVFPLNENFHTSHSSSFLEKFWLAFGNVDFSVARLINKSLFFVGFYHKLCKCYDKVILRISG